MSSIGASQDTGISNLVAMRRGGGAPKPKADIESTNDGTLAANVRDDGSTGSGEEATNSNTNDEAVSKGGKTEGQNQNADNTSSNNVQADAAASRNATAKAFKPTRFGNIADKLDHLKKEQSPTEQTDPEVLRNSNPIVNHTNGLQDRELTAIGREQTIANSGTSGNSTSRIQDELSNPDLQSVFASDAETVANRFGHPTTEQANVPEAGADQLALGPGGGIPGTGVPGGSGIIGNGNVVNNGVIQQVNQQQNNVVDHSIQSSKQTVQFELKEDELADLRLDLQEGDKIGDK